MQISDNIKANDRDFYPTVDSNFVPDGGVRIYATWTADLGDNAMDGIKAYEVFKFNNNNKIIEVDGENIAGIGLQKNIQKKLSS